MDWKQFAPPAERQHSNKADSYGCASFSAIHEIESQEIKKYGKTREYSERALAKLSGTVTRLNTPDSSQWGNSVVNVVNAIKKYGLILEADWPTTGDWTLEEFYAPIPQSVLDKAVKVDVDLVPSVDSNLAPLWTEIQIGGNMLHMVEGLNEKEYFDSYEQYIKAYDSSHVILWQGLLVLKGSFMMVPKRVVKQDMITHGVLLDTPNGGQLIYATDEAQWRSWNKSDSYQLATVKADGTTDWTTDFTLPF